MHCSGLPPPPLNSASPLCSLHWVCLARSQHAHTLHHQNYGWTGTLSLKACCYRAAFVQRNSREINSFKNVFKSDSLAGAVLEEYDLKRRSFAVGSLAKGSLSARVTWNNEKEKAASAGSPPILSAASALTSAQLTWLPGACFRLFSALSTKSFSSKYK